MTRPSGQVVVFSVRDGCPYRHYSVEYEVNNVTAAAAALEDRSAVYQSQGDTRLTRFEGLTIRKEGCSKRLTLRQHVHMTKSARRAIAGDGRCIGLTFKDQPFMHPKANSRHSLVEALMEEDSKHETLASIKFSSIRINHNTISSPHTDSNHEGYLSMR